MKLFRNCLVLPMLGDEAVSIRGALAFGRTPLLYIRPA